MDYSGPHRDACCRNASILIPACGGTPETLFEQWGRITGNFDANVRVVSGAPHPPPPPPPLCFSSSSFHGLCVILVMAPSTTPPVSLSLLMHTYVYLEYAARVLG
jgi:hypothetical protein